MAIGTFNFDGLASGLDTKSIIEKMLSVDRMPLKRLQSTKSAYTAKLPILSELNSLLLSLKNKSADLKLQSSFSTMKGTSSAGHASLSATASAPAATHTLDSVTRLATATRAVSSRVVGGVADPGAVISANGMRTAITAGSFTLNGVSVAVNETDTLDDIVARINSLTAATGVEALYNPAVDKLVLRNATAGDDTAIALGSAGDTSNFLTAASLLGAYQDTSTGTTAVASSVHLGALDRTAKLADTSVGGLLASGDFRVNGVLITVNASSDTIDDVAKRITDSAAGVTAAYNAATDRLELRSRTTGATAINLVDGTSNFLDVFRLKATADPVFGTASAPITDTAAGLDTQRPTYALETGSFRIVGVNDPILDPVVISVDATDSIDTILGKINAETWRSGVEASYDSGTGAFTFWMSDLMTTSPITITDEAGNFTRFAKIDGLASNTLPGYSTLSSASSIALVNPAHTIAGANLATPVTYQGGSAGRLSITHDGVTKTFDYDGSTTLESLLDAISNDADLGVDARYDAASDRFLVTADAGTPAGITIADVDRGGALGNLAQALGIETGEEPTTLGRDALYSLDGVTYLSNSNIIEGKIEGATLTLSGTSSTAATLTVAADTSAAKTNLKAWIDQYNAVLEKLDSLLKDTAGPYYNDPGLRDILSRLRSTANTYLGGFPGEFKSLSDIGVTSGKAGMAWTAGYIGKLELDEAKLSAALDQDPEAVRQLFFYAPNGGSDYRAGIGYSFDAFITPLTQANGTMARSEAQINREIDDLDRRIADTEAQLAVKEDYYRSIFAKLEVNMGQLQRQSQWLSSQLAQMGGFGGGSSSSK